MSERYVVKRTAKAVRIFDRASTFYTLYPKREWPDQDAAEDHAIKTCAEWNAAVMAGEVHGLQAQEANT